MKKNNITLLRILLIITVFSVSVGIKAAVVKGVVLEPYTLKPLAGASVNVTGLSTQIITDASGGFSIPDLDYNASVTIQYPGYNSITVAVAGRSSLKIVMIPADKKGIADKILLPFQTEQKSDDKQSNAYSVQKKDIRFNASETEQLLAAIPGMNVTPKSGMPGESNYFALRSATSLTAETMPLIVLNGAIYMPDTRESGIIGGFSKGVLNAINPKDIQNITVLKGSDATPYGSLASNGVILIETDKAVDLDTKVEFSSQFGLNFNQSQMPVMGVTDYKGLISNAALTKYDDMAKVLSLFPYLVDNPNYYYNFLYNNNTDWQKLIYSPGLSTDNVLKIKGGDAISKHDVSVGYKSINGQMTGTNHTKFYARLNSDVNLTRKLAFYSRINANYLDYKVQEQGMLPYTNPMLAAMKKAPLFSPFKKDADNNLLPDYAPIRNADGSLIENNMVSNPVALVNKADVNQHDYDIQVNAGLNYNASKYLTISALASIYYNYTRQNLFIPGVTEQSIMPHFYQLAKNTVRSAEGYTFNTYFNVNAAYNRTFNHIHKIKASVGAQLAINNCEYDAGTGYNTANDFYQTLGAITSASRKFFGYNDAWNWLNYNISAHYTYNYFLTLGAAMAVDAASSTGPDTDLFQLYPAFSATLNTKNSFLKDVAWLQKLNIRAEYASSGNSRFSSSMSKYYYVNKVYRELSGLTLAGVPNTKIEPERNQTLNFGIDATTNNQKLDITADVYRSIATNLIMPVKTAAIYGSDFMYKNAGSLQSVGYELGIQYLALQNKDMKWYVGATVSSSASKILDLGSQQNMIQEMADGSALISEKGSALYSFYGFKTNGVFATDADAAAASLKNASGIAFAAGDVIFMDKNGDHIIDDRDRYNLGNASPDLFGNISTSFQYKSFELSAIFTYSVGNKMYNAVKREMESMSDFGNQLVSVNRRWMSQGQVTEIPRAVYGDPMGNARFSERFIQDALFLRLRELTLSYNFKVKNGLTVFLSGENLFILTNYLGLDPESMYSNNAALRGFDYAKLPQPLSVKLGFNLKL
jgi:TonB-linked SusC/RagA family outer membrane protein